MIIIGDVHGYVNAYFQTVKHRYAGQRSVQLGDFGFRRQHDWFEQYIHQPEPHLHRILFGNHDYTPYLDRDYSLRNCSLWEEQGVRIMAIRGAWSKDFHTRTEGLDYFPDEQLTAAQWSEVMRQYEAFKPQIVLSHDCPLTVRESVMGVFATERQRAQGSDNTPRGLQACWELHPPEQWIFAHHHRSTQVTLEGTRFRCLNILEVMEL